MAVKFQGGKAVPVSDNKRLASDAIGLLGKAFEQIEMAKRKIVEANDHQALSALRKMEQGGLDAIVALRNTIRYQ